MNPGESIEENLVREIHEEVGADIMILGEIGITIEYRNSTNLMQISYCYLAKVFGELHESNLDEQEKNRGFEVLWVSLDEAIETLEKETSREAHQHFMHARDL
jgi:8-oxo-dGTP diphosphatase